MTFTTTWRRLWAVLRAGRIPTVDDLDPPIDAATRREGAHHEAIVSGLERWIAGAGIEDTLGVFRTPLGRLCINATLPVVLHAPEASILFTRAESARITDAIRARRRELRREAKAAVAARAEKI